MSYDDVTMGAVLPRCTGKLLASTERHPLNGMLALRGPLSRDPLRAFGTSLAFVTHHGYPQPLHSGAAYMVHFRHWERLLASTERHPLNPMLTLRGPLSRDPLTAFEPSLAFVKRHGYPLPLPQRCGVNG